MTQTKRYEVRGMMEWHPVFRAGRTCVQVSFTGGHLCGGASSPASCETSDPVVQKVIESSPAFRSGRIRLSMQSQVMGSRLPDPLPMPETSLTPIEFKDLDEACDFLQHTKGIPLERLVTLDQCLAEAKRLGLDLKIKG